MDFGNISGLEMTCEYYLRMLRSFLIPLTLFLYCTLLLIYDLLDCIVYGMVIKDDVALKGLIAVVV